MNEGRSEGGRITYLGAGDKSLSSSSYDLLDLVDEVVEGIFTGAVTDLSTIGVTTIGAVTVGVVTMIAELKLSE